eukprot:2817622-Rhodomonas_salina.1
MARSRAFFSAWEMTSPVYSITISPGFQCWRLHRPHPTPSFHTNRPVGGGWALRGVLVVHPVGHSRLRSALSAHDPDQLPYLLVRVRRRLPSTCPHVWGPVEGRAEGGNVEWTSGSLEACGWQAIVHLLVRKKEKEGGLRSLGTSKVQECPSLLQVHQLWPGVALRARSRTGAPVPAGWAEACGGLGRGWPGI